MLNFSLQGVAAAEMDAAAAQHGMAADVVVLLDNDDRGAVVARRHGGGEACCAGADDDDISRESPFHEKPAGKNRNARNSIWSGLRRRSRQRRPPSTDVPCGAGKEDQSRRTRRRSRRTGDFTRSKPSNQIESASRERHHSSALGSDMMKPEPLHLRKRRRGDTHDDRALPDRPFHLQPEGPHRAGREGHAGARERLDRARSRSRQIPAARAGLSQAQPERRRADLRA